MAKTNFMIKVTKNFLKKEDIDNIYNVVSSPDFPWFFNTTLSNKRNDIDKEYNFQLTHVFYQYGNTNSQYFNLFKPLFEKVDWFILIKLKLNLNPKTYKNIEHGMHIDFPEKDKNITTGLLYLNTNDGYTKFETGEVVKSVRNTFVEFDNSIKHTGATCTDNYRRLVLNVNYIKK